MASKKYDVFLSHASVDKEKFVQPLYDRLESSGIKCWIDEKEIAWGDSIPKKINEGIKNSKYVMLILSEQYISRVWPNSEIDAAVTQQNKGKKVVLPLFIGERKKLIENYPLIEGIKGLYWDDGIDYIVDNLKRLL